MSSWLALLRAGASPELVWGLVPRIVGVLYVIAFASLATQVLGLVGSRGISPAHAQLAAMREHFPGPRRFLRLPTLLWLNASDRTLALLPWCGVACGLYVVMGGPHSFWALLACFVLYLSLDVAALIFPWDCLLYEVGFLTLFLPEGRLLPQLEAASLPSPLAAFALRFLLVRLMWGFAKLKFWGTKRGDDLFLQGFLAWMPMCTPLGFRVQHAPAWMLRGAYAFMWFVEVICPGLVFFGGELRAVAALGLMSLMLGIWATGNWGFFNVGYGALCVALFDTQSSVLDLSWAHIEASPVAHVLLVLHTLLALIYFPFNSWATHAVWELSFDEFAFQRPWLRAFLATMRTLRPLRLVHAYGVFPANSSPPIKLMPVFEGSDDGSTWRPYAYRYMPTAKDSQPPIVAPHHPRIDHLAVYAGSGMSESDYLSSLMGAGKPYGFSPFSHYSWVHRLMQRLLEGEPSVRALFGSDPFPDAPPKFCRVRLSALTPSSMQHAAQTGEHWYTRDAGVVLAARERNELVFRNWLSPPELLHPDAVYYRRKSPALTRMLAAFASAAPHTEAVREASDISAADVDTFWARFIPQLASTRGDFAGLKQHAEALRESFGLETVLRLERIAERYVHALRTRLEPHMYGAAEPKLEKRWCTNFHFMLQDLVLDGREAFETYWRDPAQAVARAQATSRDGERLLHFIGVVRNEVLRYHMRTMRIVTRMTNVFEDDIPGLMEYRDLLLRDRPPEEVWVPELTRSEAGVWHCHNFTAGAESAESRVGVEAEPI